MSSRKEACDRSRVGAHGDRRQQPALMKTSSGIKSKRHLQRKRSSTNVDVDEEEWNHRMQTWEKKRQRLSGSDWDRSFREAVHSRLKGKKPWRNPISKASLHKVDHKSNLLENENNCRSSTTGWLRSDSEMDANVDTSFKQKHQNTSKENGEMPLEAVGLKRETSRMELDVPTFAHSDSFDQNVQTPKESKFSKSLKSNISKANIKILDTDEKPDDITWTKSLTLADTNDLAQSSTMFIKTVLSPIQSESECSKVDAGVQSSDGQNIIKETTYLTKEKSTGNDFLRLPEIRMEIFTDNKEMNINASIHKKESKTEQRLPSEQSVASKKQMEMISSEPINKKESKTEKTMPSEQLFAKKSQMNSNEPIRKKESKTEQLLPSDHSLVKKSLDEYEIKINRLKSDSLFQNTEKLHSDQESLRLSEEPQLSGLKNDGEYLNSSNQKTNSSSRNTSRLRINVIQKIDTVKANEDGDEKKNTQQPHPKTKDGKKHTKKKVTHKDSKKDKTCPRKICSSEIQIKATSEVKADGTEPHQCDRSSGDEEFNRKDKFLNSNADMKVVNFDKKAKLKKYCDGHKAEVPNTINSFPSKAFQHELLMTSNTPNDKSSKFPVQELHVLSSNSKNYTPVCRKNREDGRKPKGTLYNSSSLTITCRSKERALHAIFSSPDTEIFGSRKKPPAQPIFIRTELTECKVPVKHMDVECTSKEPFGLRAKVRPLTHTDESLMLRDESAETSSSSPGMWYREFQHPVMSSEELESDQTKSDCYREVIIDRSGCRSLYDGPCHTKMSKGFDKCCVRRYEVCHDTSKCALKNTKKQSCQVQYEDIKIINEAASVESWYDAD